MPEFHYRYGGSTWHRTLACPGWVRQARHHPNRSSAAADRGTLLHAALMHMHAKALKAEQMVGYRCDDVPDQEVSRVDARTALIPAHSALVRLLGPAKVKYEVQVEHTPLAGGTADFVAAYREIGVLADAKFGDGRVRVNGNQQLIFYAAAYKWPAKVKHVTLAIIQPTARPVLATTVVPVSMLKRVADNVPKVVAVAEKPDAPLRRGEHCDYCPAKMTCPEFNRGVELLDPSRFAKGNILANR